MKRKPSVLDIFAIGGAVVRSIGKIRDNIEAAKDPDSPGGAKVTPAEAVRAVVLGLVDAAPVVYERVSGEKFPEGAELLDALAEL